MKSSCSLTIENFFEPCVLSLLLRKASYGYELKQNLDKECSCEVDMGNLYRGLGKLSKLGFISKRKEISMKGPAKQVYEITDAGKAHLALWITELKHGVQTISSLITHYESLTT